MLLLNQHCFSATSQTSQVQPAQAWLPPAVVQPLLLTCPCSSGSLLRALSSLVQSRSSDYSPQRLLAHARGIHTLTDHNWHWSHRAVPFTSLWESPVTHHARHPILNYHSISRMDYTHTSQSTNPRKLLVETTSKAAGQTRCAAVLCQCS